MADKFLARQLAGGDSLFEWLNLSSEPRLVIAGCLDDLARSVQGHAVILLIPAVEVLNLQVALPVKSSRQINKALPYAVEDFLADEVENYRLAWCRQADGLIAVSAIEWATLRRYESVCQQAGIALSGIYSEGLFVPFSEGCAGLVVSETVATFRLGAFEGGGFDFSGLPLVLDKWLAEQSFPPALEVWCCEDLSLSWPAPLVPRVSVIDSVLRLYAEQLPKNPVLNLLSGDFTLKASGTPWLLFVPAVAMLVLAVALQWGVALQAFWQGQAQLRALEQANEAVFRQAFPELKRIVNIQAQAAQALVSLRKNAEVGQNQGFLFLLYKSGEVLAGYLSDPAVEVSALAFNHHSLSLRLKAGSISQLDAFKQGLEANGLKANIGSAESGSNGVQALLEISN